MERKLIVVCMILTLLECIVNSFLIGKLDIEGFLILSIFSVSYSGFNLTEKIDEYLRMVSQYRED